MSPRRRTRSGLAAMCVVGALLTAGCGGAGDDASPGNGDNPAESSENQGGGGAGNIKRVNFVPAGPTDDDTPRGNRWYEFLADGKCQALRDDTEDASPNDPPVILYRAAAEACTGQHDRAARDLNRYLGEGIPIDPEDCGRTFVIEFVQDVLNIVRADPNADITFEKAGRRPPCEKNDDDVTDDDVTTTSGRRSTTTSRSATTTR